MCADLVHRPVAELMTPYVIQCAPYTTLAEAHELMATNRIRRLPVMDEKKLVGIVTRHDILEATPPDVGRREGKEQERIRALASMVVQAIMSARPHTVYQTDTIGHAAEIMLEHKVGGLPVLDAGDSLAGVITESDIFRAIVRQWRDDNLLFSGAHGPRQEPGA